MKKLVKLLLKCILVSAPMWGMMIFLWQGREYYSNEDFGYTWWNQEFTQTTHQKYYKYLVLGDSSCNAAYMPEVISDSMVNLSIGKRRSGGFIVEIFNQHQREPHGDAIVPVRIR